MTEAFIEINQVTKNYKDPASDIYFQALRGIDLRIKEGTLSSIIGPSGAGGTRCRRADSSAPAPPVHCEPAPQGPANRGLDSASGRGNGRIIQGRRGRSGRVGAAGLGRCSGGF